MNRSKIVTSSISELKHCLEIWEKKLSATTNIMQRIELLEVISHLHKELYSRGQYEI